MGQETMETPYFACCALVNGVASGLGEAVALQPRAARWMLRSRTSTRCRARRRRLRRSGRARSSRSTRSTTKGPSAWWRWRSQLGHLDVLVNNAGAHRRGLPRHDGEDLNRTLA
jgi:NADP-dependent 3-hydroxy acid dehydrogenase YdfG